MFRRIHKVMQGISTAGIGSFFGRPSHPADRYAREIARFRFRITTVLAIRHCLRFFFAWVMVWAAMVLVLRVALRIEPAQLLWGLVGFVAAAAIGVVLAARQTPSIDVIRAALDRHGCLGGLLMASGDAEIGSWNARIAHVPMPGLKWQSARQWKLLMMGGAFLLAAFLMPDAYLPTAGESALEIGSELQKLTEQMAVLKQEQILPPDKAEVLEKDLERIREEASGKDPAKTLESLDHLEQSFSKAAAEAAESAIKETEEANQAQELAQALETAMGQMDAKQVGDAMKELAQMADQAAADNPSLAESLSDELKEACQQGNLSESQLKELAEALKTCKAGELAKLGKMVQAKLVDASMLESCQSAGECKSDELAAVLATCKDGKELADALACMEGDGNPGRGGVSRGRGDAAMTWSQGTEKGDAEFKEKVLPPSAAASLKESRLAGVSVGDPTAKEPAGGSAGGVLGSATAGGGEARSQVILPEHRKSVQRYFERERK